MKTKNALSFGGKIYLFAAALFFLSVFFGGVERVNAACEDIESAFEACLADDTQTNGCDYFLNQWNACMDAQPADVTEPTTPGPSPEDPYYDGGVTQSDCDLYGSVAGEYTVNSNGTDCVASNDSTCNQDQDPTCCSGKGGFWYENTCNSEPKPEGMCTTNGQCEGGEICVDSRCVSTATESTETSCEVAGGYWNSRCYASGDVYCAQTMGVNYTMNIITGNCTGDKGAECLGDSDCGVGKSCRELTADASCGTNSRDCICCSTSFLGMGGDCTGAIEPGINPPDSDTSLNILGTTNNPVITRDGTIAPANTTVNRDGSGISPDGQIFPPGSFPTVLPRGALTYSPLPVIPVTNVPAGPKCGTSGTFQEIGGVCFPTNTGLANPEGGIALILSNIFSWLMGLFTTFAVVAFVVSGIQYLTSAGDEGRMETAKNNATYAIIGIIVGLSGFVIIKAIATALGGQTSFF